MSVSDLTRFRDHCRKMAGPPVAPGCPAAADRGLWLRLADEVDAYLGGDACGDCGQPKDADPPLIFEATTTTCPTCATLEGTA